MRKFAKRHYEAVAEVLRCTQPFDLDDFPAMNQHRKVRAELADMFKLDNHRFDHKKFRAAATRGG